MKKASFRLRTKNKKLMKNKQVRAWLSICEKLIEEEVRRRTDDIMIFGSTVDFRPNTDKNNDRPA